MKFSIRAALAGLGMLMGATLVPSAGEAQVFYGGDSGVVVVRDHGERWHRGDRHWRGDGRRAYGRDRYHGGPRYYRGGPRYYRGPVYYGGRHRDRDRFYHGRRHYRDNGVVIRLR